MAAGVPAVSGWGSQRLNLIHRGEEMEVEGGEATHQPFPGFLSRSWANLVDLRGGRNWWRRGAVKAGYGLRAHILHDIHLLQRNMGNLWFAFSIWYGDLLQHHCLQQRKKSRCCIFLGLKHQEFRWYYLYLKIVLNC